MKRNLLLAIILIIGFRLNVKAQWSYDPNNPAIVCNAAGAQEGIQAIKDGNGGYYVFWFDNRVAANATELYGQHYDVNGMPQWAVNGKQIFSAPNSDLFHYSVIRNVAGNLFFGITEGAPGTGGDTIRVLKTDPNGNPLWGQPTLVAAKGGGPIYATNVQLIEKDSGVYVANYLIWTGGSTLLRMNRVDDNGTRLWALNGIQVPNGGAGGFGMVHDAAGGLLIYWRNGNGSGTGLGVRRMDENGNFLWTGNVNPAAGTPGLGYDFRGISDNNGGLILTWVEVPNNIKMARLDTTGAMVWSGGVLPVCVESHGQDRPRILLHNNYIFVAWLDSRPPASNANTYIQKFDLNGQPQWTLDGVKGSNVNTYIPYTRMVPSDSGSVIYTTDGNVYGLVTQKIKADSTLAWATPGTLLCDNSFNPFYDDYAFLPSVDFGAVCYWSNGNTVYSAKVGSNGSLVNVNEIKNAKGGFNIYPNPANTFLSLTLSEEERMQGCKIKIFDAAGKKILEKEINNDKTTIDISQIETGIYLLEYLPSKVNGRSGVACQKLIIQH